MLKILQTAVFFCLILFLINCSSTIPADETEIKTNGISAEFVAHYVIPFNYQFQNTTVGGLSSIDYAGNNDWFIISDDRSEYEPARFYKAEITYSLNGFDTLIFNELVYMKNKDGAVYELDAIDPEAIRFNNRSKTLFYSSEGGRLEGSTAPFIREMDIMGNFIKEYNVPIGFNFYENKGVRENGTFESLAFENDSILWFANELPLIEDGEVPQFEKTVSPIRLSKLDTKNDKPLEQFAYMIEPVQALPIPADGFNINSVVELLVLDSNSLLVMERSYIIGVGNYVKIFKINSSQATDISDYESLKEAKFQPVEKELLIDFSDYNIKIDNVEGMTFGPDFEDGSKSLVCITDNNFNETQQTQVWLFSVKGL